MADKNTLCKSERLNSRKAIETLFSGNAKSFSAFPLRVVFMPVEEKEDAPASILISVPKKRFKRAVKRNRVKRQIREAYRKNKHELLRILAGQHAGLHLAFIYLDNELRSSAEVECRIVELLGKIERRLRAME